MSTNLVSTESIEMYDPSNPHMNVHTDELVKVNKMELSSGKRNIHTEKLQKNTHSFSNEKTKMCVHGKSCKRGKTCRFAHSKEELVCLPCNKGNACSRPGCTFIHPDENRDEYFVRVGDYIMPELVLPKPLPKPTSPRTSHIRPRTDGAVHLTNIPRHLARQMFMDLLESGVSDIRIEISR